MKSEDGERILDLTMPARHLCDGKYKFVANLPKNGTWYVDLAVAPPLGRIEHVKTTFTF